MGFSLDDYINSKKKKGEQAGQKPNYFQFGQQPKAATSPSVHPKATTPTGSPAGGGSGFSLDDFIITKGIRTGQLQQQDNDFNSWMEDVQSFSKRMSGDYTKRQGTYQAPDTFRAYQDQAGAEISELLKRAYTSQDYYTQYGGAYDEVYGAGRSKSLLDAIAQNIEYLEGARKNLSSEGEWWKQFADAGEYDTFRRVSSYSELPKAADFEEKSKYVSTYQPGTEKFNAWSGTYTKTGFGDIDYDYINRDEIARARQALADIQSNAALLGLDNSERGEMTDEEIALFNYIYATQSLEAAYQYIKDITGELNYRQRQSSMAEWAKYAEEHPVASSAFSVLESPMKGLSYLGQIADYAEDGQIDQNAGYNKFSYINSAIRGQVAQDVEKYWVDRGHEFGGKTASFLYQTGMSMGDFLLNTGITGGNQALTLAIMGTGAAADGTIAAKDRGLSDDQAFALGTIAGAAEIITEKISLEALLKPDWEKGVLNYIIKNALAEGSEEVGSDIINLVADVMISKDKSEWAQSVQAYMAEGFTEAEATGKAVLDQALSMGVDFLGGALSGGIMAGAAGGFKTMTAFNQGRQFNGMELTVEDIQAFIDEGLASDPSTQAYQLAVAAQQKLAAGGTLTNYELGNLYQANARAIEMESDASELLEQAARDAAEGKRITNSTAKAILDSPSALSVLTQEAGLVISEDMSKSQQREAVRSAVKGLASPGAPISQQAATTSPSMAQTTQETQAAVQETRQAQAAVPVAERALRQKQMENALASLGEQGLEQGKALYNSETQDPVTYYRGFVDYYNAGVSGLDMGKVQGEYTSALNDAQRQAAYLAGKADAAASLEAERAAVKTATVYGGEAGFIQNDYSADMDRDTVVYFNRLAQAAGVKIQIGQATGAGGANGWYANGIITIAADAENPGAVVATHEITHRMQEMAPAQYRAYRDYAMQALGSGAQERIEGYKARYAEAGQNLTTEQAMDEIAADFTADLLRDVDGFRELANTNRSVARKLLDAVRDFIRKVKAAFKGGKARNAAAQNAYGMDMATLEEAARLWGKALEATQQAAAASGATGSVVGTEGGYAQVEGKFSLKGVVEEGADLLALHNLTEKNLLDAARLGGLPMPSIAIVKAEAGHSKYGPISLVFDKAAIDPQADSRNKVYGADAWTPTAPDVEREVDYQIRWRVERDIEKLAGQVAGGMFAQGSVLQIIGVEDVTAMDLDQIAEKLANNDTVRAAYLADHGQQLQTQAKAKEWSAKFSNDILQTFVDRVGVQELAAMVADREAGGSLDALLEQAKPTLLEIVAEDYTPYSFNKAMTEEVRQKRKELFAQRQLESPFAVEDAVKAAWDMYQDGGATKGQVDRNATQDALRAAVSDDAVAEWVRPKLEGLLGEPGIYNGEDVYTEYGDRRSFEETHYDYTLENIVEAMQTTQEERGGAVWGVSATSLQSVSAPRYGSIADIKADSGRLGQVETDAYNERVSAVNEQIEAVVGKIEKGNKSRFSDETHVIQDTIVEAAKGKHTVDAIMRTFSEAGYSISSQTAKDLQGIFKAAAELPTEYFEAKPQRAVGFEEVLAAVVPESSSQELRSALTQLGVPMLEYATGDDGDRLAKVNSVKGAKFSLKTDSKGRELTQAQQEYFKDSKAVDSQGRLRVLYHGTGAEFTVFDSGRIEQNFQNRGGDLGFYFTPYIEDAKGYAKHAAGHQTDGTLMEVYLNLQNPLVVEDEGWGSAILQADLRHGELARWAKDGGHDGIIVVSTDIEMVDGEYDTVYVAFSPEQIKNVDNPTPTADPDIRRSLKKTGRVQETAAALEEENTLLRERLAEYRGIAQTAKRQKERADYWQGQTRRTKRVTTDSKAVAQAARQLISRYGAQLAVDDIQGDLQGLYDYIASGYDGNNELTYEEARARAEAIAARVAQSALVVDDDHYQQYKDLRNYLRTTQLSISKVDNDIPDFGDFHKRYYGKMRIGTKSTNIDTVYMEMAGMWPGLFDAERETHPTDQLLHIADVLDEIYSITEYNPFSYDMRQATGLIANEIMEQFFELPQTKATMADKWAAKVDAAKQQGRERLARLREEKNARIETLRQENQARVREAIQSERAATQQKLQRMKDHNAQVRKNQAARRADSKARTRLLKIAQRLQNRKLPAANRALLDQYIGELDTVSKSMTGATVQKLTELRDWYNDQKQNDPDFISDPATERKLERLSKRQINGLTSEEVAELTEVLLHIENELRTERQLIDSQDRRDVYHMGEEVIRDLGSTGGAKSGGVLGALDKFIVTETLSPVRQLRRMVGYLETDPLLQLTEALADGQRAMLEYQMQAEKPFEQFAEDKQFNAAFSGPKAEGITIGGLTKDGVVEVTISPAMRASLYLHSLNDQNLRHIRDGGITVPDWTLYQKGKLSEAYARGTTIKLTPSQVRAICQGMTEQEKAFAKAAAHYFNDVSAPAINAVSEKLKGYSIAQVENYFPINTDTSFTKADFEAIKFDGSIEGMGWTKERVNAANPIMLRDVNAVLEQSIQQHGKYVALAIPVRNFNKVWGVTTGSFNEDGSRNNFESSVQKAVKQKWGETGYNYVEKMMSDLQGGQTQKNAWAQVLNRLRSNYAGAVLTLNASVAMKQAASYPTAAAVLGWGPLIRAMGDLGKVDLDLIAKYTPLQWYRSKGYSTRELGDLKRANRQLPTVLNWVQGADLLTTRKLWKASEYYVQANNKSVAVGTDAYYRAVAEVYNRVIEETQPNYTTMQRPQLLRSDDTLMGNLAMFKTQPFQNFNILYDAAANLWAKTQGYKAGTATDVQVKTARQNFRRAVTSQLAQLAVFAGMTAAWAFFRGKRDKYEDEETGEVTLESFLAALNKDMVGGLLSDVPFGSDVWELASSKLFGDKYYGMDAVTITAITDTVQSVSALTELVGDTLSGVASGEEINWTSARLKMDNCLDDISKAAGVPYENVINLFNATYRQTCIAALGKYQGEYEALKMTTDPEKYSKDYYDLLYKALQGDRAAYEAIYEDMVGSGTFAAEKVQNAMEKRMKAAQGVEKASELERRYLSPAQETAYDKVLGEVAQTDVWRSASAEQRGKAEDILYDLTVENSTGTKLREKIAGGAAHGIDEADYILFRLALEVVDQPTESGKLGSYTNDEVEEAIGMLDGLTDAERSYLWTMQGKSDKSNPWG